MPGFPLMDSCQESKTIDALGPVPTARELSIEGREVKVATMMTAVRRHIRGEVFVLGDRTMFPSVIG